MKQRNGIIGLLQKLRKRTPSKIKKLFMFGLVGGFGAIVNTGLLYILTTYAHIFYLISSVIATEVAIISNFVGNHIFTFRDSNNPSPLRKKFLTFQMISITTIVGTVFILWLLTTSLGIKYLLVWNLAAIFIMFLMNFFLNHRYTWKQNVSYKLIIIFLLCSILFSVSLVSAEGNATLNITDSTPFATIILSSINDSTIYNTSTGDDGNALILDIIPGNYNFSATRGNYTTFEENIFLEDAEVFHLTFTLVRIPQILESGVLNITNTTDSPFGSGHEMFETETAVFYINLDESDTVIWKIDGEVFNTTVNQTNHTFAWIPGYLFASTLVPVNITAHSQKVDQELFSWKVDVDYVINPYFQSNLGEPDALVHVFTNNKAVNFTNVSVTLKSMDGNTEQFDTYVLDPLLTGNEVDWKKQLFDLPYGNNFIVKVTGYNSITNTSAEYELPTEGNNIRAHYRNFPPPSDSGGGGSGGGSSNRQLERLELIYVNLEKEVLYQNETQVVTLDAKARFEVRRVKAVFVTPSGGLLINELELISGHQGYGTWSTKLNDLETGPYLLKYINITGEDSPPKRFDITGRSFYVIDKELGKSENLMIVYVILDKDIVEEISNVTLTLDARDYKGITEISADIQVLHGNDDEKIFIIPFTLIEGNANYGTWEGVFEANQPDTTYNVIKITLSNEEETKSYDVDDRSVYATQALPVVPTSYTGSSILTGNVIASFVGYLKKPFFPTFVGFFILTVVTLLLVVNARVRELARRKRRVVIEALIGHAEAKDQSIKKEKLDLHDSLSH